VAPFITGDTGYDDGRRPRRTVARGECGRDYQIGDCGGAGRRHGRREDLRAAVSSGQITCEEAAAVSTLLDAQRKAIETESIEKRLDALEARK
jgi:hypothetical protein